MVLIVDSDATYLVLPQDNSRITDYCQLGPMPRNKPNRTILIECNTLYRVIYSVVEAKRGEISTLYKKSIPI